MIIWKVELDVVNRQHISIPTDAVVLAVQVQNNKPCIWFTTEQRDSVVRTFRIIGTGISFAEEPNLKYIGTFQLLGGKFVGHLFEELEV